MELQSRYEDLTGQGLGVVAISYDSPETLKKFADSRGITFPMISDLGSAIIKRYGLLNQTVDPGTRAHGVPHPGTFIVDRRGIVTARYFEDAYQERNTAASILVRQGVELPGSGVSASTAHLTLRASISDTVVAPGERLSIVIIVTPRDTIHVYAPGRHAYQIVQFAIDPQPWLRVQPTMYPPSEVYHFRPLDEKVAAYSKSFRLTKDVTIVATPEVQKLLAERDSVTLSGALEYQACDRKVCYNPGRVPVSFTLTLKTLDRRAIGN